MSTDAAEDAREKEEQIELDQILHSRGECEYDCPYCEAEK